ncbi:hypothetical protein B0O99DRAFT_744507 [Bisporella sp. PMI_857]|nr:hypothetical protein B0O99DRAFT_744507 [Bisporella sp. PMI_857]
MKLNTQNDGRSDSSVSEEPLTPCSNISSNLANPSMKGDGIYIAEKTKLFFDQYEYAPSVTSGSESHERTNVVSGESSKSKEVCCTVFPLRPAVWSIEVNDNEIALSSLATMTLIKEEKVNKRDLKIHAQITELVDRGPTDPVSGILSATHSIIGAVLMGVLDYPIEVHRMVKEETSATEFAKNFGTVGGKGVGRIVGAALRAPMDVTLGVSQGFHNVDRLMGGDVRPQKKVTGIKSGSEAAVKGLGLGIWDGVTGIVTEPIRGGRTGGWKGSIKGVGKGLLGVVCKPAAGATGLPAYLFKGAYEEVCKVSGAHSRTNEAVMAALLDQAEEEWKISTSQVRRHVVQVWDNMLRADSGHWKYDSITKPIKYKRFTTPTKDEVDEKPWKYIGYRGFAEFLGSDGDFYILRRLGSLNARIALYLQDQISILEKKPDDLDEMYSRRDADDVNNGSLRDDQIDRADLIHEIVRKFTKYSARLQPAAEKDIESVRNWHFNHGNLAIDSAEQQYLTHRHNLISIVRKEKSAFRRLLERSLSFRIHPFWRLKTVPQLPAYGEQVITYTSDKWINRFITMVIMSIGTVMLIAPLWILQSIGDVNRKLTVITAFIVAFLGMVSYVTSAKPFETLGATAA